MTNLTRERLDAHLLEDWQRGLPIVPQPFAKMAETLGVSEADVLERLKALKASGAIARVGGVVRPNTLGASTLAALAANDLDVERTAELLTAEPGVNHVYLRENDWNLWIVVTGPDRDFVDAVLQRISRKTGLRVLDLRLETPYFIDLGFELSDKHETRRPKTAYRSSASHYEPRPGDRELVQSLMVGLPLQPAPFDALATQLGRTEYDVIARIEELSAIGVLPRIGVIVRHRALGWRSNAMVVWDVAPADIDRAGRALASVDGINLCYRRKRHERDWPYNLYCMVHAKTREVALETLARASKVAGLDQCPRQILFSLRCFKQTGALVASQKEAA